MTELVSAKAKIICFLFDPNIGGPTIRARLVYERMQAEGYDIRVAFPNAQGTAVGFMKEKRIAVDRLPIAKPVMPRNFVPFVKFALKTPIGFISVFRYLKRQKPDVIHVNGAFDIVPALAGKLAGIPVVWHLNDTVFGPKVSRTMGWLVRNVADEIVIAATRVGEHYNVMAANPRVVFAPVDVARFQSAGNTTKIKDPATITLIGNWNWIKGHDKFVTVIGSLVDHGFKVKGLIVGKFLDGQKAYWEPILQQIENGHLKDSIDTPGFVKDVVATLAKSDLLLLTSHSEASPMSVLEAMAMGVPIVSFDVGGVQEMIGQSEQAAGIVVPAGDVEAMQTATARLLDDKALYESACANGIKRAKELFSLEICVEKHKAAYKSAIRKRRGIER